MQQFPHLVQMHKQDEPKGLVVISLALDPHEPKKQEQVLKFLNREKASFRNVVLAEGEEMGAWEDKFVPNGGLPVRWVYDRDGKGRRFEGGEEKTLQEMETYVNDLLARK